MPTIYLKIDIGFDLLNDPDPELEPIVERYTPGWNDGIYLSLKTDYVIPYGFSLSTDELVDGVIEVKVNNHHLEVKCSGIFKIKMDKTPLEAIEAGGTTWYLGGIPHLYGRLGKVRSNNIQRFDPTTMPESGNPSTYEYQRQALCEADVVVGPEIDVLIAKTKSALKS
jgi:hypothetical protein